MTAPSEVAARRSSTAGTPPEAASDGQYLFAAFLACRTTLHELSLRTRALGVYVSSTSIAAHLTGKSAVSDVKHNAVADAINGRLEELSLPAAAPHRKPGRPVF